MVPRRFILSRDIILFPVFKFASFSSLNAESLVVEGKKDRTYLAKSAREFSFQLNGNTSILYTACSKSNDDSCVGCRSRSERSA